MTSNPAIETSEDREPPDPASTEATPRSPAWIRWLSGVLRSKVTRLSFLVIVVALLVAALVDQGGSMWRDIQRLSAPLLLLAFAANVASLACSMMIWRELLVDLGSKMSLVGAWRINFIAQLGKYLPGKVWQIVAQAELSKDAGIPRERSAMAALLSLAVSIVTGGLVAAATLPFGAGGTFTRYLWALLVVPLGFVTLSPPVMNRLIKFLLKILKRPPLENGVSLRGLLRATGWSIGQWLLYGFATFILLHQLGDHRPSAFLAATGAYALSWVVGFLALIAPAGLGAREAVIIAALSSRTTTGTALAIALLTRGLAVAADAATGLSAVALVGRARLRRLRVTAPSGDVAEP